MISKYASLEDYYYFPSVLITRIFKIKPSCGILKGEFQLVVIQMTPKEAKAYDCMLNCQLVSAASVHSKVSWLNSVLLVILFNYYFLEAISSWIR